MGCQIIRRIRLAHCKRGPETCEKCREMDEERLCLLDVFPPGEGLMQRRLIEVEVEGEPVWHAYEVVRVFADEEEAQAYAGENGVTDVPSIAWATGCKAKSTSQRTGNEA